MKDEEWLKADYEKQFDDIDINFRIDPDGELRIKLLNGLDCTYLNKDAQRELMKLIRKNLDYTVDETVDVFRKVKG